MRNYRRSPQVQKFVNYSIDDLKRRAAGRWVEILQAAGMPMELLESRRGMPCPKCGGIDRFSPMDNLPHRGAVICRGCFNSSTVPRNGDGISTLQWWLGLSLNDACRWLGEYLGGGAALPRVRESVQWIPIRSAPAYGKLAALYTAMMTKNLLGAVAERLGLPTDPLARLGVGWSPSDRATTWPMKDATGAVIGIRLRCPTTARKWSVRGSAHGLFYCSSLLSVERTERLWIVEGNTDAAAMLSLGFDAVGVPSAGGGCELLIDLARRILPREIVILADADDAGRRGAERLADAVVIVAPVRIVSPPQGIKDARAWVISGASRELIEAAADAATVRRIAMEGK